MSIESELFAEKTISFSALRDFGFQECDSLFVYRQSLMEGDFEALIQVDPSGTVKGQVLDLETGEDYQAFRVARPLGAYARKVLEEYSQLLLSITTACTSKRLFHTGQANRLAAWIQKEFADSYDHPFAKYPAFISYRHPANQKWYALLMRVERKKLDLQGETWSDLEKEELVEIINLKVDTADMAKWLKIDGIYPSYHMNKKMWISVVLDEKVSDDCLFELLASSRKLVAPKGSYSSLAPNYWLVPANPKVFDVDAAFAENPLLEWTQKSSIQTGDIVCLYMTAPIRAIRYLCLVKQDHVIASDGSDKQSMYLQCLQKFEDDVFSFERMKELGVKAVRSTRRMTDELKEAIEKSRISL